MATGLLSKVFPGDPEAQEAFRVKLSPAILKVSQYRQNLAMSAEELKAHATFFEAIARWVKEDQDQNLMQLSQMALQEPYLIQEMFNSGQDGVDYFVDMVASNEES